MNINIPSSYSSYSTANINYWSIETSEEDGELYLMLTYPEEIVHILLRDLDDAGLNALFARLTSNAISINLDEFVPPTIVDIDELDLSEITEEQLVAIVIEPLKNTI